MKLLASLLLASSTWSAPVRNLPILQRAHEAGQRQAGAVRPAAPPFIAGQAAQAPAAVAEWSAPADTGRLGVAALPMPVAPDQAFAGAPFELLGRSTAFQALEIWSRSARAAGAELLYEYEDVERAPTTLVIPGDGVEEERSFRVGRFLGRGETTAIHRLADDPERALRQTLPEPFIRTPMGMIPTPWFMTQFIEGHEPLKKEGVPVVDIHDSRPGAFAVVDYVEGPLLRDVLRDPLRFGRTDAEGMVAELEKFAAKTAAFASIGDFKSDQLLFDKKRGWVLFDWLGNHDRHDPKAQTPQDAFQNVYREPAFANLARYEPSVVEWFSYVMGRAHAAVFGARRAALATP